jgi:hypothetical protein
MFEGLPIASLPLGRLLGGSAAYTIPSFQRPFAWGVNEARQLLDDVSRASGIDGDDQAEPDYFLGMVLLLCPRSAGLPGIDRHEPETSAPAEPYQIIDGQQRLLTLTILFAVLRDLTDPASPDVERVSAMVSLAAPAIDADDMTVALPRYRLGLNGRERGFFQRNVQRAGACRDASEREEPPSGAARSMIEVRDVFVAALVPLEAEARRQLADYLIRSCHVVVMLSHDVDRAHRLFTVVNERGKPLQRKDILKAGLFAEVAADNPAPQRQWEEAEQLLGSDFEDFVSHLKSAHGRHDGRIVAGMRDLIREVGGPAPFMSDVLLPYARIHAGITSAASAVELAVVPYARHLVYLNRLNGSEWKPAAMLTLRKYSGQPEIALALIAAIDRFAHLLRLLGYGSGKRVSRFRAVIHEIESGGATGGDADVFQLSRDEIKVAVYNLRDLYERSSQISKVMLLRINDTIEGRLRLVDHGEFSIEHVLPQRPKASSVWREAIRDPELRERATESLGNLTLVPKHLNQKARNNDFEVKRAILEAALDADSDFAITRDVLMAESWELSTIIARERRFLAAAAEFLGIDTSEAAIDAASRDNGAR